MTRSLRIVMSTLVVALFSAGVLPARQSGSIEQPYLALTNCKIVNIRTGGIATSASMVLRDGRIVSIGPDPAPAGARVLDLDGGYVLPGLIDAHTHLSTLSEARRALESGVTTVRSASVGSFRDVVLRDLVKAGYLAGPDMLAAGLFVTPDLGEAVLADARLAELYSGVNTEAQLRRLVRIILDHGVDVVKTRGTERAGLPGTDPRKQVYSESQIRAVVEEAEARGIPVMCHAHGDEGALAAVKAGVHSIEHGTYMSDATLKLMRANGTYLVPTYSTVVDLVEPGGDYDDPILRIRGMHMLTRLEETVKRAHAMGIKIAAGADTSYGPQSVTRISHEIVNFSALGMSPLEAIQSATTTAAELLKIEGRTGALEPGLEADIIAVAGDPLQDIRMIEDVLLVISNGRIAVNRLPFGIKE